jgi:hypothetical protein
LFFCACSDGTTLTPRAAVRISVNEPEEQGGRCMFGPHEAYVGGDSASKLPDAYNFGTRLVDEENGTTISCRVAGKDTFKIRASAEREGVLLTVTGEVPNAEFEDGQNGEGEVQVLSTKTAGQSLVPVEGSPCRLTPVKVAPGRVWAEFYCPNMEASRQQDTFCSASGFFVFENCER